eukprot:Clim_evm15s149 gene=Clim_evmTU15s149
MNSTTDPRISIGNMERHRVKVKVPATSANMGPGYDSVGVSVDIWNYLTVERAENYEMIIKGEGAGQLPTDDDNLVVQGCKEAFRLAGKPYPTLRYICENGIPFSRGLGSSSAAIVSGVLAGLVLAGHELGVEGGEEFLQIAARIEGHPDNVAPAIYGGLQIGAFDNVEDRWTTFRVTVPAGVQAVLFVPDAGMETSQARGLLKPDVKRSEAIFNIARVAILVRAFEANDLDSLRIATEDALHQPQRSTIMPFLKPIVKAALDAGAHGAYLSGAGSTILAFTSGLKGDLHAQKSAERRERHVARAMREAADACQCAGRILVTRVSELGAHVVEKDPPDPEF